MYEVVRLWKKNYHRKVYDKDNKLIFALLFSLVRWICKICRERN